MRVLLTTDPIGGVWTFTKELTGELLNGGHAVALVSFGRELSREQQQWCCVTGERYGINFLYESCAVPLEWMADNDGAYSAAEAVLLRVIDRFAPDLFHSGQFCFGRLPVTIPTLITAHSDVMSWAAACRVEGLAPSPWLDRYRGLVQQGLGGADAIAAPTRWMLQALTKHFRAPSTEYVVLNGRTAGRTAGSRSANGPRRLQAVTCGRLWDEAKNLSVLSATVAAFPILVAGECKYDGAFAPPLAGNAVLLGMLSEEQLFDLFTKSSIYLATSIYEPFGFAPLEAALCGCAVIANEIASLREVWGDAALYFSDAESLTRLLARLSSEPSLLERARERSRMRALELTSVKMASGYLAIYEALLNAGPRADLRSRVRECAALVS